MKEQLKTIRYFLEVTRGENAGRICFLDDDPVIVGSTKDVGLCLTGESVMPEHAIFSRERGALWLENLSSGGVLLNRQMLNGRARIAEGDRVGIGEYEITIKSTAEKTSSSANRIFPLIILLIFLSGVTVIIAKLANAKKPVSVNRISRNDWQKAYSEISAQVSIWEKAEKIPAGCALLFREAWTRDLSGAKNIAISRYGDLFTLLSRLSIDGITPRGETLANFDLGDANNLLEAMEYGGKESLQQQAAWNDGSEAKYAQAWWFFVVKRLEILREK